MSVMASPLSAMALPVMAWYGGMDDKGPTGQLHSTASASKVWGDVMTAHSY